MLRYIYAEEQKVIKVGWFELPGYMEITEDGEYSGYIYDYLQDIKQYTDWEYEFVVNSFPALYEKLKAGEIDLLAPLSPSTFFDDRISYSYRSIGQDSISLYTTVDSFLAEEDFEGFDGISVGTTDPTSMKKLKELGKVNKFYIKEKVYANDEEVSIALTTGEIDAAIRGSYSSDAETREILKFATSPFNFAVCKKNEQVFIELNNALRMIQTSNPNYHEILKGKYRGDEYSYFTLTEKEKEYINNTQTLVVSHSTNWNPFEMVDPESGGFKGIVADVFDRISTLTGLKFEYHAVDENWGIEEGADIIASFVANYDEADQYGYNLTMSYMSTPMVLIRQMGAKSETGKTAIIEYYYPYTEAVGKDLQIITYDTPEACVEAVRSGEAEQAIISSLFAGNLLEEYRYAKLSKVPLGSQRLKLAIAVNENLDSSLLSILNKAVNYISEQEMNDIIIRNTIENRNITLTTLIEGMPGEITLAMLSILCVIVLLLIITLKNKKKYEKQIKKMLYLDDFTGLLSREGFEEKIRTAINNKKGNGFIVDLNVRAFKNYNALYGRGAGDKIICEIAENIKYNLREHELGARVYADHFVMFIYADNVETLVGRIQNVEQYVNTGKGKKEITIHYGIYEVTDEKLPIKEMMDCAIVARRSMKGDKEKWFGVYDVQLHREQLEERTFIDNMKDALRNNEFKVFYQPKYTALTEKMIGAEALVRWEKDGQMIPPYKFIDLFESNGQIAHLDLYMFEKVCQRQIAFKRQGILPMPVSVNFSQVNLYDLDFPEKLTHITEKYGCETYLVELEFTETSMIADLSHVLPTLKELKEKGFTLAMDDFGSGYSSLNALKDLPVDVVKLDRGFMVYNGESHENNEEKGKCVIKKLIELTKELHIKTVAEGVETKEQLEFLKECGCDVIQGYYFSKPLPEEAFEQCYQSINKNK